jgi:uncharacterized protein (TIGR03000 family)
MYSVVLLMAVTAGSESADFGHRRNGGDCTGGCYGAGMARGGCYGGGYGGCYGSGYGGCYGSAYAYGGCSGRGYGGCYGGGYGGCYGRGYASSHGCYGGGYVSSSGCHGGGYASSYGGCYGGGYVSGGGCYGGGYAATMTYGCYGGGVVSHGCHGSHMHHGHHMHHGCHGGVIYHGGHGGMIHHGCCGGMIPGGGKVIDKDKGKGDKEPGKDKDDMVSSTSATLVVSLPADARLTIDGQATTSVSSVRTFTSPELQPGRTYVYTLQAVYTRDGEEKTVSKKVHVWAGRTSRVDLNDTSVASR